MKDRMILSFCMLYILFHLTVAFLSIRSWPMTDYPMFSKPDYKENKNIWVYKYSILYKNGKDHPLKRSFAYGFGSNEWNISKLVKNKDMASVKKIFSFWLSHQKSRNQIKEIRVFKVIAERPFKPGEKLKIKKEVALKIPVEELNHF